MSGECDYCGGVNKRYIDDDGTDVTVVCCALSIPNKSNTTYSREELTGAKPNED